MADNNVVKMSIIWALIIGIFILALFIIKPIAISIVLALLLGFFFHPLYNKINLKIKNKSLAAIVLILLIILLIALPIFYFTPSLLSQSFDIYGELQNINLGQELQKVAPALINQKIAVFIDANFNTALGKTVSAFMDQFVNLIIDLPNIALQMFIFIFTFFFVIKDYDKLIDYFLRISPLPKHIEIKIMKEFRSITNSVIVGQALIGVLQGLALGLAFWLLGFNNILTLTVIGIIAGLIPIGPVLVWLPASIFMIMNSNGVGAIILFLYGILVVSNIDHFLRPYLLSRSSKLPMAISMIGIIGGLFFLGIIGLVLGPLILAYAMIIIEIYQESKTKE